MSNLEGNFVALKVRRHFQILAHFIIIVPFQQKRCVTNSHLFFDIFRLGIGQAMQALARSNLEGKIRSLGAIPSNLEGIY